MANLADFFGNLRGFVISDILTLKTICFEYDVIIIVIRTNLVQEVQQKSTPPTFCHFDF
jgi:hypothetical protein